MLYRREWAAVAKAFGCRPVATIRVRLRAGVREPSRKGPAGRGWTVACRLWGSDEAAAWVGDAFAGVVGGSDDHGSEFAAAAAVACSPARAADKREGIAVSPRSLLEPTDYSV